MSKLAVALLGPLQVTLDGEPVAGLASVKARALLAFLAVEADRAHSREALSTLLWPDTLTEAAFDSLRHALAQVRQALGDHQPSLPVLLATRGALQLNPAASCWVDVAAFKRALSEVEPGPEGVERLERATAIYRGEFLADFRVAGSPAFDDWAAAQREDLSRRALTALQLLAAIHTARGDLGRAEESLRRQLALAPWQEEAHRELMRVLALAGRRSEGLAQYELCRRALKRELEMEPGRETADLAARIRNGEIGPVSAPMVGKAILAQKASGPSPSRAAKAVRSPTRFVAREREFAWLDAQLAFALNGDGRVAFVIGDAGSGKTSLIAEFTNRAMQRHGDLVAVTGSCNAQTGTGDPYLPFCEALQMLAGDVEAKRAGESVSPEHARRLWEVLPDVLQALVESGPGLLDLVVPGRDLIARTQALGLAATPRLAQLERILQREPAFGGAGFSRSGLVEQVTRVLRRVSQGRALVVILDDLQWADQESISLLFHLSRRLAKSRILLLGAYRQDEVAQGRAGERHPLEAVLNELAREYGEVCLDLDQAEGRRFVTELLDSEPNRLGESFRERLYGLTGGHALFTVELLKGMEERGHLIRDDSGRWVEGQRLDWGRFPARVEAVIAERIARLPKDLQSLLAVGSVEGEEFTAEVVARVLGVDEREVAHRLSGPLTREHRIVVARRFQRLEAGRQTVYRFRHVLFRQFLYGRLDEAERAGFHEAVGCALEAIHGDSAGEIAVALAWHFEAAGMVEKALDHLLQATSRAVRLSANAEALAYLGRGCSLLAGLPESTGRDRRELDLRLAAFLPLSRARGWGSSEAGEALTRARRLSESLGESARLWAVLGLSAYAAIGRGRHREGIDLAQQLLSLAEQAGDRAWRSVANRLLAICWILAGQLRPGHEQAERAMALYDPEGERLIGRPLATDLVFACLQADELALWLLGYPDRSARRGREALAHARGTGDPDILRMASATAVVALFLRRQYAVAREAVEEAERLAANRDDVQVQALLAVFRGRLDVKDGKGEQGLALMRRGIDAWRTAGTVTLGRAQMQLLAEACLETGQVELGLATVREALDLIESSDVRHVEAEFYRLEGELLLKRGGAPAAPYAEARFLRAIEIARGQAAKSWELRAATSLARLWQHQGKSGEAHDLLAGAFGWFAEGFDMPDLQEARALLSELAACELGLAGGQPPSGNPAISTSI